MGPNKNGQLNFQRLKSESAIPKTSTMTGGGGRSMKPIARIQKMKLPQMLPRPKIQ